MLRIFGLIIDCWGWGYLDCIDISDNVYYHTFKFNDWIRNI